MEITNNVASLTPKKVSELRSSFFIPDYQRGYRWGRHNVRQLLNDIRDSSNVYYLQPVVVCAHNHRDDDRKEYDFDVIDGQQRLTTLSILFSVMANSFHTEAYRNNCKKYLQEEGNILEGIAAQPRIFLRDWDQDFFSKYIQDIQLDALVQIDPVTLDTEAKMHIQKNCTVLREKFSEVFNDENKEK